MTPTDDEAACGRIASDLADAVAAVIPDWATPDAVAGLRAAGRSVATALDARVRAALAADIDAGVGSPLAILRSVTGPATEELVWGAARAHVHLRRRSPR